MLDQFNTVKTAITVQQTAPVLRDDRGRFKKGGKGGPGRKRKRLVDNLEALASEPLPFEFEQLGRSFSIAEREVQRVAADDSLTLVARTQVLIAWRTRCAAARLLMLQLESQVADLEDCTDVVT